MKNASLILGLLLFTFSVHAEKVEPKPGTACFSVIPLSPIDDKKCSAVRVDIQFVDCTSQSPLEKISGVSARFECKRDPKRLKYWNKNTMLFAELEKTGSIYSVKATNSLVYASTEVPAPTTAAAPVVVPQVITPSGQLAFQTSPIPEPTPTPEPVPVPVVKQIIPATIAPATITVPGDVKISGGLDTYYLYNQNLPAPVGPNPATPPPVVPPTENIRFLPGMFHDQFTVNMAQLDFIKEAKPIGFKIGTTYGSQAFIFSENKAEKTSVVLSEAYFKYKAPFDLEIKAGKMTSFLRFEDYFAFRNINYTFSLGQIWASPAWFTGIEFKYPMGDAVSVSFYLLNGWNKMYETNASKTFGGQVKFTSETFEFTVNALGGNETYLQGADIRSTIEGIISLKPDPNLLFAVDYVATQESISGNSPSRVSSLAGFFKMGLFPTLAIAARYELYTDDAIFSAGLITSPPSVLQNITSITGTLIYEASKNLSIKAEYRLDTSDGSTPPYTNPAGTAVGTQSLGLLAGMVNF